MGTLFDQPRRDRFTATDSSIEAEYKNISSFAKRHKISFSESLELHRHIAYERRTNAMIMDGDIYDEQMSGFGELAVKLIDQLDTLNKVLSDRD